MPTWLAIPAAAPAAAFAALLIGPIALWLRGAYFIIVTLSFSIVLQLVTVNWVDLTNGPMGIFGIPYPGDRLLRVFQQDFILLSRWLRALC